MPRIEDIVDEFEDQEDVTLNDIKEHYGLTRYQLEGIVGDKPAKTLLLEGVDMEAEVDQEVLDFCWRQIEEYDGYWLDIDTLEEIIPVSYHQFREKTGMGVKDIRREYGYDDKWKTFRESFESFIEEKDSLSMMEARENGFDPNTVIRAYDVDSWSEVIEEVGLEPSMERFGSLEEYLNNYVDIALEKSGRPLSREYPHTSSHIDHLDGSMEIPLVLGLPDVSNDCFKVAIDGPLWSEEFEGKLGYDRARVRNDKIYWMQEFHTMEQVAREVFERYPDLRPQEVDSKLWKAIKYVKESC